GPRMSGRARSDEQAAGARPVSRRRVGVAASRTAQDLDGKRPADARPNPPADQALRRDAGAPARGTVVSDARFEDLVGRLLDDELTPDEWSKFLELVRDDPALLEQLRDQLEASELLALSEDPVRGSPLFLEATRSRLADDGFVSGVRAALAGRSTG